METDESETFLDKLRIAQERLFFHQALCLQFVEGRAGRVLLMPSYANKILSRQQWAEVAAAAKDFYAEITDEDIEQTNQRWTREAEQEKRELNTSLTKRAREVKRAGFVYLIKDGDTSHYKIGRTKNVTSRLKSLNIRTSSPLELIHAIKTKDAIRLEAEFHNYFGARRIKGEWFALSAEDVRMFLEYQEDACA
jgi:Meiotically up-regulated gene 113